MNAFFDEMAKDKSLFNLAGGRSYDFSDWFTQKSFKLMESDLQGYPENYTVLLSGCHDRRSAGYQGEWT